MQDLYRNIKKPPADGGQYASRGRERGGLRRPASDSAEGNNDIRSDERIGGRRMQAVMITAIIVFGLVGGFVSLCYIAAKYGGKKP